MSEYDFVYEPDMPEDLIRKKKSQELASFMWTVEYEDMLLIKKYIKKYPEKFSERIKGYPK
jgi:hypothetical protein